MHESISIIQKHLLEQKQAVVAEIESLIDEYWMKWRDTNRRIIDNRTNAKLDLEVGSLAPSIRVYKTSFTERIVVRWRIYQNNWARLNLKKGKPEQLKFANEVPRLKDGTTSRTKLINKATPWEEDLIHGFLDKANELIAINTQLHSLHKSLKKFYKDS